MGGGGKKQLAGDGRGVDARMRHRLVEDASEGVGMGLERRGVGWCGQHAQNYSTSTSAHGLPGGEGAKTRSGHNEQMK